MDIFQAVAWVPKQCKLFVRYVWKKLSAASQSLRIFTLHNHGPCWFYHHVLTQSGQQGTAHNRYWHLVVRFETAASLTPSTHHQVLGGRHRRLNAYLQKNITLSALLRLVALKLSVKELHHHSCHFPLSLKGFCCSHEGSQSPDLSGSKSLPRGARRRMGLGRGCDLFPGGGLHVRGHQDLGHLPAGSDGGVWGEQQPSIMGHFHLCLHHDLHWLVPKSF